MKARRPKNRNIRHTDTHRERHIIPAQSTKETFRKCALQYPQRRRTTYRHFVDREPHQKSVIYKKSIFFCKKHWLNMRNQPTCSLTSCKSPRNILPAWRDNAAKWRYLRHRALNLKIVSFVLAQTFYMNDILLRATLLAIYLTIRLRARVFYEQIVNEATIARRKRGRVV